MSELKLPEVNRVTLSGRLTRDPEKRYASDGTPVCSFTLAFHRPYRSREGSWEEHTGFVTVMSYLRLAEVCALYLRTGSPVLVEGRLQMREWQTARGEKRQSLEVRAESVHFLEKASADAAGSPDAGPTEDPSS